MINRIIESPNCVDNTAGPQCEDCTHYHTEHNGPNNHCMHVLYTVDEPGVTHPPRKLCPCKVFTETKLILENILLDVDKLDIGTAKKLRIMASVKRSFSRGIESEIDLDKLASMSRKQLVFTGYDSNNV